jgi:hypothetical protein
MRIPVCVLRNHKPRPPALDTDRPAQISITLRIRNTNASAGGHGQQLPTRRTSSVHHGGRSAIGIWSLQRARAQLQKAAFIGNHTLPTEISAWIYHPAGSVESQPDASSLSLVYRCATRSALWANNKCVKRCNVGFWTVTADVASSSLVVPAILSKVRPGDMGDTTYLRHR